MRIHLRCGDLNCGSHVFPQAISVVMLLVVCLKRPGLSERVSGVSREVIVPLFVQCIKYCWLPSMIGIFQQTGRNFECENTNGAPPILRKFEAWKREFLDKPFCRFVGIWSDALRAKHLKRRLVRDPDEGAGFSKVQCRWSCYGIPREPTPKKGLRSDEALRCKGELENGDYSRDMPNFSVGSGWSPPEEQK